MMIDEETESFALTEKPDMKSRKPEMEENKAEHFPFSVAQHSWHGACLDLWRQAKVLKNSVI